MPNSIDTIFGEELWFSGEHGKYDVQNTACRNSDMICAQQSSRKHASSFDAAMHSQKDSDDEDKHTENGPPSLSIPPFVGEYGNRFSDPCANTAMEDNSDDAVHSQKDSDDEDKLTENGSPSLSITCSPLCGPRVFPGAFQTTNS